MKNFSNYIKLAVIVIFVSGLVAAVSVSQENKSKTPKQEITDKWEYSTHQITGVFNCSNYASHVYENFIEDLNRKLKTWGEEGWELVSFTKTGEDKYYLVILKRKKNE